MVRACVRTVVPTLVLGFAFVGGGCARDTVPVGGLPGPGVVVRWGPEARVSPPATVRADGVSLTQAGGVLSVLFDDLQVGLADRDPNRTDAVAVTAVRVPVCAHGAGGLRGCRVDLRTGGDITGDASAWVAVAVGGGRPVVHTFGPQPAGAENTSAVDGTHALTFTFDPPITTGGPVPIHVVLGARRASVGDAVLVQVDSMDITPNHGAEGGGR